MNKVKNLKRFRVKLILTFVPIAIISMISFSLMLYFLEKHNVESQTRIFINEISMARAREVGNWIEGLISNVKVIALSDDVRSMDENRFLPYIKNVQKIRSNIIAVTFVAKPDGAMVNSLGLKSNISDREYYKNIMFHKSLLEISEPIISKTLKKPVIVITTPIITSNGKIIGIVGESVLLDNLSKIVKNVKIGEYGYAWIMNGSGLTIAYPNKEYPLKFNLYNASKAGFKRLSENAGEILSGKAGQLSYSDNRKQEIYITYSPIPNTKNWVLGIITLKKHIFQSTSELLNYLIVMTVILILIVLLSSYYVSGKITKPIKQLVSAVKSFEKDKKEISVELNIDNEIGELANAFSAMTKTIIKHTNNLEAIVVEKTKELLDTNQRLLKANTRLDFINGELREKNDDLYILATKDSLTGIINRYELERRLSNCIEKADRNANLIFSVLFIDLDNFKYYNDNFGHDVGDEVLKEITVILKTTLRNIDVISRYGGDEFVIIIEEGRQDSEIIGDRIIKNIREKQGFQEKVSEIKGQKIVIEEKDQLSCSIGVIEYNSEFIKVNCYELLRNADKALYKAKRNGKSCVYSISLQG